MKKLSFYILFLVCFCFNKANAQTAIFSPGLTTSHFGTVSHPGGERDEEAIDGDINTKFLDFDEGDGMGFNVDLGGGVSEVAMAIEVTTANDAPGRDPLAYEVFGSAMGTTYTSIASGIFSCSSTRHLTRVQNFTNGTSYRYYRINFPSRCGSDGEMQVAEVQLYDAHFCLDPTDLSATNITATSADLSWTESWTATTWDIEWGVSGFSPTGTPTINNTTSNPHSLTGLTASTSYDFYVRADCGGSTSSWVGPLTFVTSCLVSGVDCGFGGLDVGALTCAGSPYAYSGNTSGANDDCSQRAGADHMYTFTLDVESDVEIENCESWDGYIYLYNLANGQCGSGSINSDDDGGCGSLIASTTLSAGTYVILIEPFSSGSTGAYDLTINVSNCQNTGDDPCDAIPSSVSCGSKVTGSNVGKTNSGIADPSCGTYSGGDVWFEAVVSASGEMDIDVVSVASSISDVGLAAYTAASCGGAMTEISCNSSSMPSLSLTGLTAGNTLYLRVWENGNDETGSFELEVTDPSSLYCLNGDASMYNFPVDTCMQVTSDVNSQRGCAWYQNTLDFSENFDHTLEVYLGDDDAGADGMTFTFHNDPQGTAECGNDGRYLVWVHGGIDNALVIEVDTYDNDDPWFPYLGFG